MNVEKIPHWALSVTTGEWIAFAKKVGGAAACDVFHAVLRGELTTELKQAIFFDKNGQRLIPPGLKAAVTRPTAIHQLHQPELDYADILPRLVAAFLGVESMANSLFALGTIAFKAQSDALLAKIAATPSIANILNGVHLPIVIPQFEVTDYGHALQQVFFPAVGQSYESQFPRRHFHQHLSAKLAGNVSIVNGSRHERLVERMKDGPVVGIYFPNPLQGWSVDAQREQMGNLYSGLLLAGGIDSAIAQVMYPGELSLDANTPYRYMAAIKLPGKSLYFNPMENWLTVSEDGITGATRGYYSGGLTFIG
ncbi:MAG: hypothetical protein WC052_03650 [Patescibacteria group bacterium]|jgi:hypothetical protein